MFICTLKLIIKDTVSSFACFWSLHLFSLLKRLQGGKYSVLAILTFAFLVDRKML